MAVAREDSHGVEEHLQARRPFDEVLTSSLTPASRSGCSCSLMPQGPEQRGLPFSRELNHVRCISHLALMDLICFFQSIFLYHSII
jgi:hypothetical protein